MSGKTSRIALTSLTILLTATAGYYRTALNCGDQPVAIWIVGCLFLLSVGCILTNTSLLMNSYPKIAYAVLLTLTPVAVLAVIAWSILGSVWIIQNLLYGNRCLPLWLSIGLLWGMLVTHIAVIISLLGAIAVGLKILFQKNGESCIKKQLMSVYSTRTKETILKLDELMDQHKDTIETMPLFQEEQEVLRQKFTQQVTEPSEDECAICLSTFEADELKSAFGCTHNYHLSCITEWLSVKANCPCCRQAFRPAVLRKCRNEVLACE